MEPRYPKLQRRQELKSVISLVDCTVRVSPTLARLIRKCAATEAGGASAHDALLASAGLRAGEIEALRDQKGQCAEELSHAREHATQLQRALDHAQGIIARHDKELVDLRREMTKAAETDKGSRNLITALKGRVGELQLNVANHEVHLMDSIAMDGLDEAAVTALKALRDGLCRGEDIKAMALSIAGYSLGDTEAAMSKQDRAEIRAFDTLLTRRTWRRRVGTLAASLASTAMTAEQSSSPVCPTATSSTTRSDVQPCISITSCRTKLYDPPLPKISSAWREQANSAGSGDPTTAKPRNNRRIPLTSSGPKRSSDQTAPRRSSRCRMSVRFHGNSSCTRLGR